MMLRPLVSAETVSFATVLMGGSDVSDCVGCNVTDA